jgi:hypothetical protein
VIVSPRWLSLLATLTAVSAGAIGLFYATGVGRLALVDQWERAALAFGQPVNDAQYETLQRLSANGPAYAVALSLLGVAGAAIGVAALAYIALRSPRHSDGVEPPSFRQLLAVGAHSAVILTLRNLIAAPVGYLRETTASMTSVGRLFPSLNETSPAARALGAIDLLVLWWLVVLSLGLAIALRRPARPLFVIGVGLYLAVVVALVGVMAASGGVT